MRYLSWMTKGDTKVNTLATVGYEGASIGDFLATLKVARVKVLIDVRAIPFSRKPGFSQKALSENLEEEGIEYLSLKDLGNTPAGREAAAAGDMEHFESLFVSHMKTKAAQRALSQAVNHASEALACLLCFERKHRECHRLFVAQKMAEMGHFNLKHLGVQKGISTKEGGLESRRAHAIA